MPRIAQLPQDQRYRLGGMLFLLSLLVFFLASLLLYGIYAKTRWNDLQSQVPLPNGFLYSTGCLMIISGLLHWATRLIRREKRVQTSFLLGVSAVLAVLFMSNQFDSMRAMLASPAMAEGTGKGVVGMIAVLAFLHALHVAGGVISLGLVASRSARGFYDHERHWAIDFTAQYWHFLDLIWLSMLAAFWVTTGGFSI